MMKKIKLFWLKRVFSFRRSVIQLKNSACEWYDDKFGPKIEEFKPSDELMEKVKKRRKKDKLPKFHLWR